MVTPPQPTSPRTIGDGLSLFKVQCPDSYTTGGFVADVGEIKGDIVGVIVNSPGSVFRAIPLQMVGPGYESWLKFKLFDEDSVEIVALTDVSDSEIVVTFSKGQTRLTLGLPTTQPIPPATVPAEITDLTADLDYTSNPIGAALAWTEPDDGGSPILGYRIYSNSGLLTTLPPGSTSFVDTTVVNGANYLYNIRAFNAVGDGAMTTNTGYYHTYAEWTSYPNPRSGIDRADNVRINPQGTRIYAWRRSTPDLYISIDAGVSWTTVVLPGPITDLAVGEFGMEDSLIATNGLTAWLSVDSGATWSLTGIAGTGIMVGIGSNGNVAWAVGSTSAVAFDMITLTPIVGSSPGVAPIFVNVSHITGEAYMITSNGVVRKCPMSGPWITITPTYGSGIVQAHGMDIDYTSGMIVVGVNRTGPPATVDIWMSPLPPVAPMAWQKLNALTSAVSGPQVAGSIPPSTGLVPRVFLGAVLTNAPLYMLRQGKAPAVLDKAADPPVYDYGSNTRRPIDITRDGMTVVAIQSTVGSNDLLWYGVFPSPP